LEDLGLLDEAERRIMLTGPKSYKEFIALEKNAAMVVTDSGGIQEESTYLGVPCLTVRPNTERPVTITMGTNKLVEPEEILEEIGRFLEQTPPGQWRDSQKIPPMWDGLTAERIGKHILNHTLE
jgi:UDP-N-acetylglucosamine 2-epimerase (non-hydrolysing)